MANIEYCDSDVEPPWHPAVGSHVFCEDAEQAEIDVWIAYSDALWFAKPDVVMLLGEVEKAPVTITQAAAPDDVRALEERFREQAEKWDLETAHMSSPLQRMMHPSYQAILGMSAESPQNKRDIIRFMLHDLKTNHREWPLALSYLTQHNPINPKDYGKTDKITAAWIKWGSDQGLL
jgi:hypothetical protein